ncbi:hypothetical protein Cgig2_014682 [Carnegiea gigantea]|uniref:Uncharacterized protein n=1 Tax=Carnegiea gigantea TaxID=171969 RepID=A0A9Q1L1S1_9CARY|nr:hypothetical protein Cgig2_014682 [Carnegiea gigantea]
MTTTRRKTTGAGRRRVGAWRAWVRPDRGGRTLVVVGDGDERVEVFAGELVLEGGDGDGRGRGVVVGDEGGELGHEGGELDGTVDGEDLSLATDVGEEVVVGSRLDLAAVAHHELHLVVWGHLGGLFFPRGWWVFEVDLPRTRGGVAGVWIRVRIALHGVGGGWSGGGGERSRG